MPLFRYVARDDKNGKLTGKVEARNERQAVQALRERKMVVISVQELHEQTEIPFVSSFTNRVGRDEVVTFTQQLATMLSAGLPLTEAIQMLKAQSKPAMAKALGDVLHDVQGGASLGDAMSRHPEVFTSVYISLIRTGEASGKLDTVLTRLAENEEKQRQFRSKTKGAMIYPAIIISAIFIVLTVIMVFVVPQMTSMYEGFGAELPFATQLLVSISNFARGSWYIFFGGIGLSVFALMQLYKTPKGRLQIDTWLLKIPVYGTLRTQVVMTEFSLTLSLLVGAGIAILDALEIVVESVDNMVYKTALQKVIKGVEKGMPLASMIAQQLVFPPLLPQMVSVGEETGELEAVLIKVAKYYEQISEQTIKNLTTAIEPLIMIVLGVVVAFIVFAVITPIYQITQMY